MNLRLADEMQDSQEGNIKIPFNSMLPTYAFQLALFNTPSISVFVTFI